MKKLVLASLAILACAALYVASPFLTAFSIREAIKQGNSDYLADKIEWPSVRETMRQSLAEHALDLPGPLPSSDAATPVPSPSLWQRLKTYAGRRAVDAFVDTYVNAEGLPQLHQYRRAYRENVAGILDDPSDLPRLERMKRAWQRVIRAEFHSLTEFEIEQRDRIEPTRSYVALFKLRGVEWKLTELRVKVLDAIAPMAVVQ
jgi:hypothetical protein